MPGTRYWALQTASTGEMVEKHLHDIYTNMPDFIVFPSREGEILNDLLEKSYIKALEFYPSGTDYEDDRLLYYLYVKSSKT